MAPEGAAAERVAWIARVDEVAAIEAEIVDPVIDHEPGIGDPVGRGAEPEKLRPVVEQRGAEARAAEAEVVDVKIPVDTRRRPPHTEHLKHVPAGEDLCTEDLVILHLSVIDVESWLLGIGCQHRPPQHGDSPERDRVAAAGDELLMGHGRLTCDRIDHRLTKRTRHRYLLIGELEFAGAKLPRRYTKPARREASSLGDESTAVDLADHISTQSYESGIVIDRRQQRSSSDHATRPRHVVKHAHCLDYSLPLPEDDIALHVELQRCIG